MKMLLWKDYRLSRICLLAGATFLIIPYILLLIPKYIKDFRFEFAWMASVEVSQLTMAFLAGNIIACERADRSAVFLAYQGASRKMLIGSKLIICTLVFALLCLFNFFMSQLLPSSGIGLSSNVLDFQVACAIFGLCFFGCCWLISSLQSSSAISIVSGFIVPFVILYTLLVIAYLSKWELKNTDGRWYFVTIAVVGLISLVAGTWYFIRSKES